MPEAIPFYANENIEGEVVAYLRSRGHDVRYGAEIAPREADEQVLERATEEGRILLTNDKDFGALCFKEGRPAAGVILIRCADQKAISAMRTALAISVNVMFLAGRNGNVEPSTMYRFSKSWLSPYFEVVNRLRSFDIGSVPA